MSETNIQRFMCDSCCGTEDATQDPHLGHARKPTGWTRVVPTCYDRDRVRPTNKTFFDLCPDCSKEWYAMMDGFLGEWGKP